MRREQTRGRWRSKAERNLAHGLGEVRRLASALELSDSVRDQACQLFRSAQNEDLLRGRSIEAIAAASVYGTCRCKGRAVILDEVADSARVELSRVRNAYKTLNTELGLPTPPRRPQSFIPRFASELDVADTVRQRAFELAKGAEETIISNGCQPTGVAAACLYKAAREQGQFLTQTDLAEVAETTPVTIRTRWNELEEVDDSTSAPA